VCAVVRIGRPPAVQNGSPSKLSSLLELSLISGIEHMEKNLSRILPKRLSSFVGANQAGSVVHARQQAEPPR
jgi:hypothetical protein